MSVGRLQNVVGIGVDRMGQQADAARDPDILRLENLDTDLLPPAAAVQATIDAVTSHSSNSYLPFLGHDSLRQAAAAHVSRLAGVAYDWQTSCIISAGGTNGILNALLALVEPGTEIVLPDPIYVGLVNRVRLAGGAPVFVRHQPTAQGWRLDLDALRSAHSRKVRGVLWMSPSMPSGAVMTVEEWQAMAEFCQSTGAWLLYDAAMERILYNDSKPFIHPASLPGMASRTITVGSVSKEYRMIGWRVGWIVGPAEMVEEIARVSISNVVCQVGISQAAAQAALTTKLDGLPECIAEWKSRRDLITRELEGLPLVPADGGWSVLLDTAKLGIDSTEASNRLFEISQMAVTPMIGWGDTGKDYVRLVFSNESCERLRGIGDRVRRALPKSGHRGIGASGHRKS
jgi:N-succinyldiaminopimelate aminotransferase